MHAEANNPPANRTRTPGEARLNHPFRHSEGEARESSPGGSAGHSSLRSERRMKMHCPRHDPDHDAERDPELDLARGPDCERSLARDPDRGSECDAEHEADLRRLAALRPIDDDFMRVMFQGQLALAQDVLRTITGVADLTLVCEEVQHDVRRLAGARSVVLDVYGEDAAGRRYDLEVQRAGTGADPRRARYHGSAMDVEALGAGRDFSDLPERYVVFVTEDDVFGRGVGAYRFEAVDASLGVALGDGAHVVYANGRYRGDDPLGHRMHDFMCADPADMTCEPLAERVKYLKTDRKGVSQMCKILEDMRAEAMEKGIEKGMEKGRLQALCELVRDGALPIASAAERSGMTPEQFAALAASNGLALS